MREKFDKGGKWLLERHGNSVLWVGGLRQPIRKWRAAQPEVVEPAQLPDGLLEVWFAGQKKPDYFLVEVATYPEERVHEQAMRGALLVLLARKILPEVLTLVLRPRGSAEVRGEVGHTSRLGWTETRVKWRVMNLWEVPAADVLAVDDVGLVPWLPLTQFEGEPQPLLEECRRRIERHARREEQGNLLALTQVFTQLRFSDPNLLTILGGTKIVIESPLIQKIVDRATREARAETRQQTLKEAILRILEGRFGTIPEDVTAKVKAIHTDRKLREIHLRAALCPDLKAFCADLG